MGRLKINFKVNTKPFDKAMKAVAKAARRPRFGIYFPWGRGLGTLGFRFGQHYADLAIRQGAPKQPGNLSGAKPKYHHELVLFTAIDKNGVYGNFCSTRRSWYRLTLKGWSLYKREDYFGTWKNGKRQPPIYEWPVDGLLARTLSLRKHFEPYRLIAWYGEHLEVISYPSPEANRNCITVMMRQPGDPTTMREVVLEEFYPK